jgi:hypothetical protein
MILATVPGMVVLGGSEIRAVSRFSSAIFADLDIRGVAISFLTLARLALPSSFLPFLCASIVTSRWQRCSPVSHSWISLVSHQVRAEVVWATGESIRSQIGSGSGDS